MENKKKPKTTLKDVRKKMKKLTLAEKKQVKEEKQQQKQKEKESKQKQKITQRVKININIPSQKSSTPQIQNPLSSSNRDQINLLTSINEQLKRKDEPKKATENFNIPVSQQTTQTEPPQLTTNFDIPELIKPYRMKVPPPGSSNSSIVYDSYTPSSSDSLTDYGSYNTPNSLSFFPNTHSDSSIASSNEENLMEKIQKKVNERIKNENIKKKDEAISNEKLDKLNQTKQQVLINEEIKKRAKQKTDEDIKQLGDAFKKDDLINRVKQIEKTPLIDKPKDTSNLSLLEKVKEGSKDSYFVPTGEEFYKDLDEISREFENLNEPKTEDELQRFSPKLTTPLTPPQDTTGESLLEKVKRGRKPDTEEEKKQKAEEKKLIQQEKERVAEIEKRRKINEAENRKQEQQDKNKIITEKAFNILLQMVSPEEEKDLREAYDGGFIKDKEIKQKLKKLKYTPEQIKRIYSTEE
jgi:hypothetical protein